MSTDFYMVVWDDENGENMDLVVVATSVKEALGSWRQYYDIDPDEEPERVWKLPKLGSKIGPVEWGVNRTIAPYNMENVTP